MDHDLQAAVARLAQDPSLPAPPTLLPRLMRTLARDDFALSDVVTLVESDSSAAAGVLTAANSPLARRAVPAQTVRDAVSRLGAETTRGIVVHNAMRAAFQPRHPSLAPLLAREWALALDMASVLRPLAGTPALAVTADEAVTLALLHNLGIPPLLCAPPSGIDSATADDYYRAALPHAAALGGLLARQWQLGEPAYRVAIGCHQVATGDWQPVDTIMLARQRLAAASGFTAACDDALLAAVLDKAAAHPAAATIDDQINQAAPRVEHAA